MTKVVEWFGFKRHLLVDVKHEVVLSYEITDTRAGDGETLPTTLGQAKANLLAGRIETLAYDRAADSDEVHRTLSGKGITPLIQMLGLWKTEPDRRGVARPCEDRGRGGPRREIEPGPGRAEDRGARRAGPEASWRSFLGTDKIVRQGPGSDGSSRNRRTEVLLVPSLLEISRLLKPS